MPDIFSQLAAPFSPHALSWRVARSGMTDGKPWAQVLVYVDARAVRARLNAVVGPDNWVVAYRQGPGTGIIAKLSLRIGGEWIAKEDGADKSDIEPVKGALSAAFKRAAITWGIGEYLYDVGDSWAQFSERGAHRVRIEGHMLRWDPPKLSPAGPASSAGTRPEIVRDAAPCAVSGSQYRSETFLTAASRVSARSVEAQPLETTDAVEAITVAEARTMLVPFGRMRGRPLERMLVERPTDVRAGRDWASQTGRFRRYVAAVDLLLAS